MRFIHAFLTLVQDLSEDMEEQLKEELKNCRFWSFCCDESTDCSDKNMMCYYIRYVRQDHSIGEEFLGLHAMAGAATGEDILDVHLQFVERFELLWEKLASGTTDGAGAMTGRNIGFMTRLVNLAKTHTKAPVKRLHCIIHQESLASKFEENAKMPAKVKIYSQTMRQCIQLVNQIRKNPKTHREFRKFVAEKRKTQKDLISENEFDEMISTLDEFEILFGDLLYHVEARWLSKGNKLKLTKKKHIKILIHTLLILS